MRAKRADGDGGGGGGGPNETLSVARSAGEAEDDVRGSVSAPAAVEARKEREEGGDGIAVVVEKEGQGVGAVGCIRNIKRKSGSVDVPDGCYGEVDVNGDNVVVAHSSASRPPCVRAFPPPSSPKLPVSPQQQHQQKHRWESRSSVCHSRASSPPSSSSFSPSFGGFGESRTTTMATTATRVACFPSPLSDPRAPPPRRRPPPPLHRCDDAPNPRVIEASGADLRVRAQEITAGSEDRLHPPSSSLSLSSSSSSIGRHQERQTLFPRPSPPPPGQSFGSWDTATMERDEEMGGGEDENGDGDGDGAVPRVWPPPRPTASYSERKAGPWNRHRNDDNENDGEDNDDTRNFRFNDEIRISQTHRSVPPFPPTTIHPPPPLPPSLPLPSSFVRSGEVRTPPGLHHANGPFDGNCPRAPSRPRSSSFARGVGGGGGGGSGSGRGRSGEGWCAVAPNQQQQEEEGRRRGEEDEEEERTAGRSTRPTLSRQCYRRHPPSLSPSRWAATATEASSSSAAMAATADGGISPPSPPSPAWRLRNADCRVGDRMDTQCRRRRRRDEGDDRPTSPRFDNYPRRGCYRHHPYVPPPPPPPPHLHHDHRHHYHSHHRHHRLPYQRGDDAEILRPRDDRGEKDSRRERPRPWREGWVSNDNDGDDEGFGDDGGDDHDHDGHPLSPPRIRRERRPFGHAGRLDFPPPPPSPHTFDHPVSFIPYRPVPYGWGDRPSPHCRSDATTKATATSATAAAAAAATTTTTTTTITVARMNSTTEHMPQWHRSPPRRLSDVGRRYDGPLFQPLHPPAPSETTTATTTTAARQPARPPDLGRYRSLGSGRDHHRGGAFRPPPPPPPSTTMSSSSSSPFARYPHPSPPSPLPRSSSSVHFCGRVVPIADASAGDGRGATDCDGVGGGGGERGGIREGGYHRHDYALAGRSEGTQCRELGVGPVPDREVTISVLPQTQFDAPFGAGSYDPQSPSAFRSLRSLFGGGGGGGRPVEKKSTDPESAMAHWSGTKKIVIRKKCPWKNYPELENFLIANRDDYLRHSAMNYSPQQRRFNNRLTERLLEMASRHGYVFDEADFDFVMVRDRIRCYYKSYMQYRRKKGVGMIVQKECCISDKTKGEGG